MTIDDIRRANAASGFHFFDAAALRFFRSRICRTVYGRPDGRAFFVTSERVPHNYSPRSYTVRVFDSSTGSVGTWSEFQKFSTRACALGAAYRAAYAVAFPGPEEGGRNA